MMNKTQRGVAALMTVLVIVSTIVVIGLIMAQMGVNELLFGLQGDRSGRVLQAADACAEEAYFRVKRDSGYTGGTITVGDGTCTVIVSGAEPNRVIVLSATVSGLTRHFSIDVTTLANNAVNARGIDVTHWEEQ